MVQYRPEPIHTCTCMYYIREDKNNNHYPGIFGLRPRLRWGSLYKALPHPLAVARGGSAPYASSIHLVLPPPPPQFVLLHVCIDIRNSARTPNIPSPGLTDNLLLKANGTFSLPGTLLARPVHFSQLKLYRAVQF